MTSAIPHETARLSKQRGRPFRRVPWLFALPALALYAFITLIPTLRGAGYSFTSWNGISPTFDWVGFQNFIRAFQDEAAWGSIWNTVLLAIGTCILQQTLGLAFAIALNSRVKSRNLLRAIFFAPFIITTIMIAYIWQFLYNPLAGINGVFDALGLSALTQNWLGDPDTALASIGVVVIWQYLGGAMVIYLARLQSIPAEIFEAAEMDGASWWRTQVSVVIPLLRPAFVINITLSIIGGLKIFDQIWVMTGGGPGHATETLATVVFESAFVFGEFSYGAALALLMTVLVGVLGGILYYLLRRGDEVQS